MKRPVPVAEPAVDAPEPVQPAPPEVAPEALRLNAPDFDGEMACRRDHCYPKAADHCFDTCYKYNHPRDPETHTRCNQSCRESWDIDACEQACHLDRRAFEGQSAKEGSPCIAGLESCRGACSDERRKTCEYQCLAELRLCETKDAGVLQADVD